MCPTETKEPLRYTILPGVQTPIAVKTLPDGVCTVRFRDGKHTVKVYADLDGIIRFHVRSTKDSNIFEELVIDCKTHHNVTVFPIELRVSSNPSREMPYPPSDLSIVAPPQMPTAIFYPQRLHYTSEISKSRLRARTLK